MKALGHLLRFHNDKIHGNTLGHVQFIYCQVGSSIHRNHNNLIEIVEALLIFASSAYDEHRATTTNGEKEKKIKEEETLEFFFDNAIVFYSLFTSSSSSFVFLKGEMSILSDRTC